MERTKTNLNKSWLLSETLEATWEGLLIHSVCVCVCACVRAC